MKKIFTDSGIEIKEIYSVVDSPLSMDNGQ